jgi:hypothetical protein
MAGIDRMDPDAASTASRRLDIGDTRVLRVRIDIDIGECDVDQLLAGPGGAVREFAGGRPADAIRAADPAIRRDVPDSVHAMRVARAERVEANLDDAYATLRAR